MDEDWTEGLEPVSIKNESLSDKKLSKVLPYAAIYLKLISKNQNPLPQF